MMLEELQTLYRALLPPRMEQARQAYMRLRNQGISVNTAMEAVLRDVGVLPAPPAPFALNGAQEYDDTLTGQDIFEAIERENHG